MKTETEPTTQPTTEPEIWRVLCNGQDNRHTETYRSRQDALRALSFAIVCPASHRVSRAAYGRGGR